MPFHPESSTQASRFLPPASDAQLESRLAAARPRLSKVARRAGVLAYEIDDAVQETLVTAWTSLARLRSPERFDAWLDGICVHVSQHFIRQEQRRARHDRTLALERAALRDGSEIAALMMDDLRDQLHQEDLETLVDRALSHLPVSARRLVELSYLRDLPQRETAAQLGITLGALELRLHRIRRELRQVLSTALREDALAFGLPVGEESWSGWRESREWCNFCGRHRLFGIFEELDGGRMNFRMRCPVCSPTFGGDIYSTGGMVPLGGTRSFHPAFKRLISFLKQHYAQDYAAALQRGWHPCPSCHQLVPVELAPPGQTPHAFPSQWCVVFACSKCGRIASPAAFATYWAHPTVTPIALQFIEKHPRWIIEPDVATIYSGQRALQFRLADHAGSAHLSIYASAQTLQVLGVVPA